jgi:TPR repeat protein
VKQLALTGIIALLLIVEAAWAGPSEEGVAAFKRGDYVTALRLFRSLAAKGDAKAQSNLGVMYRDGQGVAQNFADALRWFRLAAAQGDATAQSNLGVLYAKGDGGTQDFVRAHMWFDLSAGSGHAIAAANRDLAEQRMTPRQIAQAKNMARDCQLRKFKGCD